MVTINPVSADGTKVVSGGASIAAHWDLRADRTVKIWDAETGEELRTLSGHRYSVLAVAVFADGKRVVTGGFDKTVKIWDTESGIELRTLSRHRGSVSAVAEFADGTKLVSGSYDKTWKIWKMIK